MLTPVTPACDPQVYFRRRTRLRFLLKAKIKPQNRGRRVSMITVRLEGRFLHIGSTGVVIETARCPCTILLALHTRSLLSKSYRIRIHLVSGDITT